MRVGQRTTRRLRGRKGPGAVAGVAVSSTSTNPPDAVAAGAADGLRRDVRRVPIAWAANAVTVASASGVASRMSNARVGSAFPPALHPWCNVTGSAWTSRQMCRTAGIVDMHVQTVKRAPRARVPPPVWHLSPAMQTALRDCRRPLRMLPGIHSNCALGPGCSRATSRSPRRSA
jgi:hypothetical protein